MQLNVLQDLVRLMEVVQNVLLMQPLVMETLSYNVKTVFILLINIWQQITLVTHVVVEQQHVKIILWH